MTRFLAILTTCFLTVTTAHATDVTQAYELLFREGTLDKITDGTTLLYERSVTNSLKPETEERDSGLLELSFKTDDVRLAHVEFRQDEKHRAMGEFPASVGNPMIMIFLEMIVRDMTENVGGSPFYIRNRIKESMAGKAVAETGAAQYEGQEITTQTLNFQPFSADPNQPKMKDFGALNISVTMSEEIPGWYFSLTARAGEAYQSSYAFKGVKTTP